jgi:hypothetical protein
MSKKNEIVQGDYRYVLNKDDSINVYDNQSGQLSQVYPVGHDTWTRMRGMFPPKKPTQGEIPV